MKRGTKVYRYDMDGVVEVATFLEESVVEGAYSPTWELRGADGRRFRTSVRSYDPSQEVARTRAIAIQAEQVEYAKVGVNRAIADLVQAEKVLARLMGGA